MKGKEVAEEEDEDKENEGVEEVAEEEDEDKENEGDKPRKFQ